MSLKDVIKSATMPFRDVPICLNGALVFEREQALLTINQASARLRMAEAALRQHRQEPAADERLGAADPAYAEHEQAREQALADVEAARARVAGIEARMRASEVVFRFTALPKDDFEQIRLAAKGNASTLYTMLARASGKHVDGDEIDDIDDEVWELLEPNLTAGQWQLIVEAIDQVNVVEGKQGLSFLRSASPATPR